MGSSKSSSVVVERFGPGNGGEESMTVGRAQDVNRGARRAVDGGGEGDGDDGLGGDRDGAKLITGAK